MHFDKSHWGTIDCDAHMDSPPNSSRSKDTCLCILRPSQCTHRNTSNRGCTRVDTRQTDSRTHCDMWRQSRPMCTPHSAPAPLLQLRNLAQMQKVDSISSQSCFVNHNNRLKPLFIVPPYAPVHIRSKSQGTLGEDLFEFIGKVSAVRVVVVVFYRLEPYRHFCIMSSIFTFVFFKF